MTARQANLLLFEVGIVAASALVTLSGAIGSLWKIKKTADDVKGVAHSAVTKL
jgi:hypothetical protein